MSIFFVNEASEFSNAVFIVVAKECPWVLLFFDFELKWLAFGSSLVLLVVPILFDPRIVGSDDQKL